MLSYADSQALNEGDTMATPMTAPQMLKALRAEGVRTVEMRGWGTHNRNHKGAWGEVYGVLIHHTAGVSETMAQFCYNGTADLPGPLCHAMASKTGNVHLVGHGRANHAGLIAENAMRSLRLEDGHHPLPGPDSIDGNRQLYGLEIENRGDGSDPYPARQWDQSVRWAAAICRFHGWTAESVGAHKEVTRRKIDPSFSMRKFRLAVAARLAHAPSWSPGDQPSTPPAKPAPAPEAPTMASRYTQLSRQEDMVVPAGQQRNVYFSFPDIRDDPNEHGPGGYTVLSTPAHYVGNVTVWPAVGTDAELAVVMFHELADGTTSTSSTAEADTRLEGRPVAVPVAGFLPAGRKLVCALKNYGTGPVTVPRVDLRIVSAAE